MSTDLGEEIFGIGQRIKEERVRLGMSQKAFATRIGATDRTIKKYEGNETSPRATELFVASSFGVDILYVITGRKSPVTAMEPDSPAYSPAQHLAQFISTLKLSAEDAEALKKLSERLSI